MNGRYFEDLFDMCTIKQIYIGMCDFEGIRRGNYLWDSVIKIVVEVSKKAYK